MQAEWLFLLTDVPSLFTSNPNTDPHAQPIYEVPDLSKLHVSGTWRCISSVCRHCLCAGSAWCRVV